MPLTPMPGFTVSGVPAQYAWDTTSTSTFAIKGSKITIPSNEWASSSQVNLRTMDADYWLTPWTANGMSPPELNGYHTPIPIESTRTAYLGIIEISQSGWTTDGEAAGASGWGGIYGAGGWSRLTDIGFMQNANLGAGTSPLTHMVQAGTAWGTPTGVVGGRKFAYTKVSVVSLGIRDLGTGQWKVYRHVLAVADAQSKAACYARTSGLETATVNPSNIQLYAYGGQGVLTSYKSDPWAWGRNRSVLDDVKTLNGKLRVSQGYTFDRPTVIAFEEEMRKVDIGTFVDTLPSTVPTNMVEPDPFGLGDGDSAWFDSLWAKITGFFDFGDLFFPLDAVEGLLRDV